MKKYLLLFAAVAFSFSAVISQIIYEDDFESYSVGDYIAVENPDWWDTWSGAPGGTEDAIVSDEQASSGNQSIKVDGVTDAILKMGNKTVGKYELSFKYYIPSGFAGYYNIQHFEAPGVEWAYEVYFGATGSGYLDAGSAQVAGFDYDPDTWVDIVNVIDLDADWTQLYIDGNLIYEWPFSWQSTSQSGTLQLGGMDVFAGGPTGETPTYYMDDLVFSSVPSALYEDDMESYNVGDYIAVVNPDWFTTWSNDPGSAEDALITDAQANSGSQSVIVEGTSDLVLKLGDKTSGKYQISFYYYIPSGFGGYYNFQHFESPGTEWAFEVYFGATGSGYLNAGASQVAGFDFDPDTWIFCDQIIDLTNDWTQLYIDGELLYEWPFSYQASSQTGTLQLGGINFYAGAPTGETATYYFDDINVTVLEPGSGAAIINLTPTVLIENINAGTTTTDMINIENTGEEALDFGVVVTYPDDSKNAIAENKIKHSEVVLTNVPVQSQTAKPGGSPEPSDDVVLNYDGENSSAVGLNNGGPMRVAANFTADLVSDYIGMELSSIEVYINDQPISTTAKVWKYGTVALPGPGEMIYEEAWTPVAMSWQTATLSDPVLVTGGDFWVGYEVDHDPATFPAGTDAGPAHPQGDWISTGPGWHHLSDNPDLNYNWNIRANLTGDPIVQWLSVDPMSGTVEVGENTDVEVSFDASELGAGTYYAELVVNSNDPQNTQIIVPVNLGVIPGIDEISKTAVMIYPNPANSFINVKGDHEIYTVELFNLTGQEVYNSEVNELTHTIATDQLDKGVYLLKATLKDGVVTQRVTIQ